MASIKSTPETETMRVTFEEFSPTHDFFDYRTLILRATECISIYEPHHHCSARTWGRMFVFPHSITVHNWTDTRAEYRQHRN